MVNFQPSDSIVKNPGYQKDSGLVYDAGRGYGWSTDLSSQVVQRGSPQEPQWYRGAGRLNNFIYTNPFQSAQFGYDLPDGKYLLNLSVSF